MAWLRRVGRAALAAVRWVLGHTRERLSPRGRVAKKRFRSTSATDRDDDE